MAQTTKAVSRLNVPVRIRGKRKSSGDLAARMALIERISDLPGIETDERDDENSVWRVAFYLGGDASDRALTRRSTQRMCCLDTSGATVNGLNQWDKYQVLSNGWGRLAGAQVCVYLPRDDEELEVVWRIIRQAYDGLSGPPNAEPKLPPFSARGLPRFSRTRL